MWLWQERNKTVAECKFQEGRYVQPLPCGKKAEDSYEVDKDEKSEEGKERFDSDLVEQHGENNGMP